MQSFGTPFAEFVQTISRIARIITFSALGIATIGVVSFEAAHQYVEHVAMPAASTSASALDNDEYGWSHLALEESWSGSAAHKGTDPRLGIKGRHAVRSAWMCVNWGGGISPSVLFGGSASNAGLGRTAITSMAGAKTLRVDDGMILATQYLNLAVRIAASKGIKLPDTDAIRAGLVSPSTAEEQMRNVDPLALALESKLASVKDRQGSRGALESAVASYERLWDVATWSQGGLSEGEKASKLVRLATKVGDLYSALERKDEAKEWLGRAVKVAATAGAAAPDLHQSVTADASGATQVDEEAQTKKAGYFGGWFSSSSKPSPAVVASPAAITATPTAQVELASSGATPAPALTRSLITALISTSAMQAQSSALQSALQTQMSALKLSSAELERLSWSSPANSSGAELHSLWLQHHQSILDLHIAETIYALTKSSTPKKIGKLLPSFFSTGSKAGSDPLEWIEQARGRAEGVVRALEASSASSSGKGAKKNSSKEDKPVELAEKWNKEKEVKVVAGRVLRDAKRVIEAAKRSQATLEAR